MTKDTQDGFIGLHTEQTNRQPFADISTSGVDPTERDGDWGAFCGGELVDGAGVTHLLEGRFNVRNNNQTNILHAWAGQVETITLNGLKLDDFGLDPATGRLRIRGHEFGLTAVFRAMGSCRVTITLNGWTPRGEGGGAALHLPAYDERRQSYVDVAPGSTFHRYIEGLTDLELIGGYDLPNDKREFRVGVSMTRGQASKLAWGVLATVARLLSAARK